MNDYQKAAEKYDKFKFDGLERLDEVAMIEKVLGLVGEAGEVADKVKKVIRDKGGVSSEEDRGEIVKELGDTLWYLAAVARYLGVSLEEVAKINIDKLEDRWRRGKIGGAGDNR